MSLDDYQKKRDFAGTPEPEAEVAESKDVFRFVVQRHDASRLHYDLRLEMDGVLKSWAVPKGPSMNPGDKRLAINTEDHPVKYLNFEGTIPKGNYGAGEMIIWDRGTFTSASKNKGEKDLIEQYENGNLKIKLDGKKLKGEFALVHTKSMNKENHWLLIKKKDKHATDLDYDAEDQVDMGVSNGQAKGIDLDEDSFDLSEMIKPMLATKGDKIFDDKNWLYEIKWDGYRALANINDGDVQLYSRNGISFNQKFKSVVEDLKKVPYNVIFDGEIVALDENGMPQFQKLQNYQTHPSGELRYYVFDLLYLNGHSIMHLPLNDRKNLLEELLEQVPEVDYCDHVDATGKEFYQKAIKEGYEGVIAKKADSKYFPGTRSKSWLKLKTKESQEALICGYTEGKRAFGSLILGAYEDGELIYIGNCGTGFDEKSQKELLEKLEPLEIDEKPFQEKINLKGREANWVKPELICEVVFSEWTESGNLRHPVYKGLRSDKVPTEITKETTNETSSTNKNKKTEAEKNKTKSTTSKSEVTKGKKSSNDKPTSKTAKAKDTLEVEGISVPVSNLEKVYWPEEGYTKYDLIDYYLKISETIMPYLKDRPQNLNRHPDGIHSEGFYQKDSGGKLPDWIETYGIYSDSSEKEIEYMLCQKTATLLYMANLGCIEINPWNSKLGSLDKPDYTVVDIDPSSKTTFEEVIEVALATKEVMDEAGIDGFCKTSGSRGIHIYLPLGAKYTYDEARDFTKLLCYYVKEKLPKLTTMERSIKKRKGRIYLDYLQNRPGQTLAAPYCLRPKTGATASAPLKWSEVKPGLDMREFNIHTMPERVASLDEDPFIEVLGEGIDISKALEALTE